jgi:GNAT superfamily N-acetyltransferase
MRWTLRRAGRSDAEQLVDTMLEGFDGYRDFSPPGWEPPPGEVDFLQGRLEEPDLWCLVAEVSGEAAGHVALMPAAAHEHRPSDEPGLGHLWQLFVRPAWWGTGLATELHTRMIAEAEARGFSRMRLYAARDHGRARRFYEREGWTAAGDPFDDPEFGMAIVEYRRAISMSV